MTRKRFVKLLMGRLGFDRNCAEEMARNCITDYASAFPVAGTISRQIFDQIGKMPVGFTVKNREVLAKFEDSTLPLCFR